MVVLYILLAIVLLIVAIMSIRVTVTADYEQKFTAELKYLFLKIPLYPRPEKEKKPKKEKKPEEPKKEEEPKPKKEKDPNKQNPFIAFIKDQGFDGVLNLISDIGRILTGMFGSIFNHVIFNKLYLNLTVSKGDAAQTAIEYGKACEKIFPVMGYICSHMKVQKYDVEVSPDFLGCADKAEFHVQLSVRPIFITNAAVAMVFKLAFKLGSKLLLSKFKKSDEHKNKIQQGGALQ